MAWIALMLSALVCVAEYVSGIFENVNNKQNITVVPREIDTIRFKPSAQQSELVVSPLVQFSL